MLAQSSYPLYPIAIALPILAGIVCLLTIPPMIWHIRNYNIAGASLIAWLLIGNFFIFFNALIWPRDNISNWWDGTWLCDIEIRLGIGEYISLPASTAMIMRGLARVLDPNHTVVNRTRSSKRNQIIFEFAMSWLLWIPFAALYYLVQPYRYGILAIYGCYAPATSSWLTLVLITIWPPVLSLFAASYSGIVIYRLMKHRLEYSRFLHAANSNKERFFRLFLLAFVLVLGIIPIQAWLLYTNLSFQSPSSYSWSHVHGPSWNHIVMLAGHGYVYPSPVIKTICGLLVFILNGTGTDALNMYRNWLAKLGFVRCTWCHLRRRNRMATGDKRGLFSRRASMASVWDTESGQGCGSDSIATARLDYDSSLSSCMLACPTTKAFRSHPQFFDSPNKAGCHELDSIKPLTNVTHNSLRSPKGISTEHSMPSDACNDGICY